MRLCGSDKPVHFVSSESLLTEKFLGRSLNRLQASAPSLTAWGSSQKLWDPTPWPSRQQTALLVRLMLVLTPLLLRSLLQMLLPDGCASFLVGRYHVCASCQTHECRLDTLFNFRQLRCAACDFLLDEDW